MARNKYNVDETLESKFDISQLVRSLVYVKRYGKLFAAAFCFSMISIVCGLILPLFTQNVIDEFIPNKAVKELVTAGIGIILTDALLGQRSSRSRLRLGRGGSFTLSSGFSRSGG